MIRTLAGFGFALALVGSAHAQTRQVIVHIEGLSAPAVRAELYKAAQNVCTTEDTLDTWDDVCVQDAYSDALRQFRAQPHAQLTASNPTVALNQR